MTKSRLRVKLELSIFWLCIFFLAFFIVGFILNNDLNKPIVTKNLYEVIRDSFTLLAYFLAPAIGLVVFNDWRKEHVEKRLEIESETVIKELQQILHSLLEFYSECCVGDKGDEKRGLGINNKKNILLMKVNAAEGNINRIKKTSINIDTFANVANDISGKLRSCTSEIYILDRKFQQNVDDGIRVFLPDFHEIDKKINEVIEKFKELNEVAITLKVDEK
ncbi:hypothetical protein NQ662_10510 [Acinetobacter baumannii]|uniref:hypothetical protein n=1 Tax=Acinetobacter baumannii TaxID=470 RepID=UPI000D696221|nr:hypothetical protein [Acinetobacter baumannii]MDC4440240.1 hypothetical protein [Acinetobacter baumannii]